MSHGYVTLLSLLIVLCFVHSEEPENIKEEEHEEKPGGSYVYRDTRPSEQGLIPVWDPNGYVFFCLCMGMNQQLI